MKIFQLLLCAILFHGTFFAQNGLSFDGIDDYIQTNFTGIGGSNARTVEAWINTTANANPSVGGTQQIITDWGSNTTAGRFTFCVLFNNAIRLESNGNGLSGTIPVNDGNWHHVAAVYDPLSTNTVKLYVDGILDTQGNITVGVNTGNAVNMRIGKRIDDAKLFSGKIDEVRVWNVAKTQAQLQTNSSAELCNVSQDLVAYYNFNHGNAGASNSGTTILSDLSGNNHPGTLNGFALSGANSNWVTGAPLTLGMNAASTIVHACSSYTWAANNVTYTSNGTHSVNMANANVHGCDSSSTIQLFVHYANNVTTNTTQCESFTWGVSGQTYTSSTTIDTVLTNSWGCSYHHVLNLTINNPTTHNETAQACHAYTWNLNNQAYTQSGTYIDTIPNVQGCDSIVTLNLTIIDLDPTIMQGGNGSYLANQSFVDYQWVRCENQTFTPIPNETDMNFTPTENGTYALIVSSLGCSDTSACFTVSGLSLTTLKNEHQFIAYPSPTHQFVQIDGVDNSSSLYIIQMDGTIIQPTWHSDKELDVRTLANGAYFIQLQKEEKSYYIKFIKN